MNQWLTIGMLAPVVPRLERNGQVGDNVLKLLHRDHIHEILVLGMGTDIDGSIRECLWFLLPSMEWWELVCQRVGDVHIADSVPFPPC